MNVFILIIAMIVFLNINAQSIQGKVVSENNLTPITKALISIGKVNTSSTQDGSFLIKIIPSDSLILRVEARGFYSQKFPILTASEDLNIGTLFLTPKEISESRTNVIDLNAFELDNDRQSIINSSSVFQPSRDLYLKHAAFNYSQAFFKVRGYDSSQSLVLIQGLPMNDLSNGRPQWSQWGGLNQMTHLQDISFGLSPSSYHFGALLATTNITIAPEKFRKGLHLTTTFSNKYYNTRLMATYNSGRLNNGWAYSVSASQRLAKEGYFEGTAYEAYSGGLALSYSPSLSSSFGLLGIYTPVKRGLSAAITSEAKNYGGYLYNPYWGYQNGQKRNSRQKSIHAPMIILYHNFQKSKISIKSSFALQKYLNARSRLNYNNTPNPDPLYYRKLPSFILENPEEDKIAVINNFKKNLQLNWNNIYAINSLIKNDASAYVLYEDIVDNTEFKIASSGTFNISEILNLDFGLTGRALSSENYAQIKDFLGGKYYEDIDAFSNTRNNTLSTKKISSTNEKIKYHYVINNSQTHIFIHPKLHFHNIDAFISMGYTYNNIYRVGFFKNERYKNSFGKSKVFNFQDFGIKSGLDYNFGGKHVIKFSGLYNTQSPKYSKLFFNSRDSNQTLTNPTAEKIISSNLSYIFKNSFINFKISTFGTFFRDAVEINYFYTNSGVGSDFFQEVTTNIKKLHLGIEMGIEYDLSPSLQINTAGSIGQYRYANNPNVIINFDAVQVSNEQIAKGYINLGTSSLKNYASTTGPQRALSLGLKYRSSKYWWISPIAIFMDENYINISKFIRTSSFFINPKDSSQLTFNNILEKKAYDILRQKKLDNIFFINIVGGKSWLIRNNYYRVMIIINNIFNQRSLSGGYEQARNGNYQAMAHDKSKAVETFGAKYWQGYGRTFSINLSASF